MTASKPSQRPVADTLGLAAIAAIAALAAQHRDLLLGWGYKVRGDLVTPQGRLVVIHATDLGRYVDAGLASETPPNVYGVHDPDGHSMWLFHPPPSARSANTRWVTFCFISTSDSSL